MDPPSEALTCDITKLPNEVISYMYSAIPKDSVLNFASTCKKIRECGPEELARSVDFKLHRKKFAHSLKWIERIFVHTNYVSGDGTHKKSHFVVDEAKEKTVDYSLGTDRTLRVTSKSISENAFGNNWGSDEVRDATQVSNGAIYPVSTKITITKIKWCSNKDYIFCTTLESKFVPLLE